MNVQTKTCANLPRTNRRIARMKLMGIVLVAMALVMGCATVPSATATKPITPEMLLEGRPLVGDGTAITIPDTDVLALDPAMLAFLDRFVAEKQADRLKVRELLYAIADDDSFGLEYDNFTRTAAETFHEQSGNCLSFTNMFVAMARHVGIDARFQEVDIPPDWTVEGGAFVLNRHVNVLVRLGKARDYVVDFNLDDFRASYDRRQIHDHRALAHYYNNMGVERMQAGENAEAFLYYRKAIDNDRKFSPPWGNLGTLYSRNGRFAYAEAAYLKALNVNSGDFVAMSNLASLYERQGDEELAATYRRRVDAHRMRNPYFRYRLAREAFLGKDYDTSIGHLKYSVRKKKNEDSFYVLLGLNYVKKGDESAARRWLEKAQQLAEDDGRNPDYGSKLEKLISSKE